MSVEENKQIALSIIEALNTRNLSVWSQHLAEDYTAEHPGVSVPLNKMMSIGYNQRFVTCPSRHPPRGAPRPRRGRSRPGSTGQRAAPTPRGCYRDGRDHPPTRRSLRISSVGLREVGMARSSASGPTGISSRCWRSWASPSNPDSSWLLRATRSADAESVHIEPPRWLLPYHSPAVVARHSPQAIKVRHATTLRDDVIAQLRQSDISVQHGFTI